MSNPTESVLALGQVQIHVVSQGSGSPIIVLGGPWFGLQYLRPLHKELATVFHVIGYDPRGSGRSSELVEDAITLEGHLADLDGIRREMGFGEINILGHSMGALVAMLYAAKHTVETRSLVLVHPGPPLDAEMQEALHGAFMAGHTAEDRSRLAELASSPQFADGDPKAMEDYFKTLYSPFLTDRKNLEKLDFGFTGTTAKYAPEAEEHLLEQVLLMDPITLARKIACPTLVIHAQFDLIPEDFSQLLAESIPGAEYRLVEGLGHFGYLEDPTRLMPTIVDFLERVA